DRVFEAKDVASVAPVTLQLQRAFATLAGILATQAVAFADAALTAFCRREVDEAMNRIDFSPEQRKVLEERHGELLEVSKQVDGRLSSVRRCVMVLRSA
ncbi:GIP, partial [Symbiodinium microadriaticum]